MTHRRQNTFLQAQLRLQTSIPIFATAAQTLSVFGSTYLCKHLFSLMQLNKRSHKNRFTDEHFHSNLRVSSAQTLTPNIDELMHRMRPFLLDYKPPLFLSRA